MQSRNMLTEGTERFDFVIDMFCLKFKSRQTEFLYQKYIASRTICPNFEFACKCYQLFQLAISFLYLISYLFPDPNQSKASSLKLKLILIVVNIVLSILYLLVFGKKKSKSRGIFLPISNLTTCTVLIINDSPLQSLIFSDNVPTALLSLPGVLCLSVSIFSISSFKILFSCNFPISVLYAITSLYNSTSFSSIFETTLLCFTLLFLALCSYANEYKCRKMFSLGSIEQHEENDRILYTIHENVGENFRLEDCINSLNVILNNADKSIKEQLEPIIKTLVNISGNSKQGSISYIEKLSNQLDDDDKTYLKQLVLPPELKLFSIQHKFKVRHSIDKIIEKVLSQDAILTLKQVSKDWNIDMFMFNVNTNFNPIHVIGKYSLKLYKLIEAFKMDEAKIDNFFKEVQTGYKNNPYHNAIHGADVLASGLFLISNSELKNSLSNLEMLIVVISHVAHDIGHPGFSNRFLINSQDPLALQCK